jgi:hypothetical protein
VEARVRGSSALLEPALPRPRRAVPVRVPPRLAPANALGEVCAHPSSATT